MNNYDNRGFANFIYLLFPQDRGIKLKLHNCVISNLLCTKYKVPKIRFDVRSILYGKNCRL